MKLSNETQKWLGTVKENFPKFTQEISENYLHPLKDSPAKEDLYTSPLIRKFHGAQHVNRVAAYIRILVNFCREIGYPEEIVNLSEEEVTLLQLIALFHDLGREKDNSNDRPEWEKNSTEKCKAFLKAHGITDETALKFADYISDPLQDFCGKIFQAADALDGMRVWDKLILTKINLFTELKNDTDREKFIFLAREIRSLIASQFDLAKDCSITLKETETPLVPPLKRTFDEKEKEKYELSPYCYQETTKDFKNFRFLDIYYHDNSLLDIEILQNKTLFKTPTEVNKEKFEHMMKERGSEINEEFHLKNISPENASLFIETAIRHPSENKRFPLRQVFGKAKKHQFTVTVRDEELVIVDRFFKEKKDKTTDELKFSQFQSTTYISSVIQPDPFAFSEKHRKKLFGVLVRRKNTEEGRKFTKAQGTVGRGYHFKKRSLAEDYIKGKENVLFGKSALLKTELAKNQYNISPSEILTRLFFDPKEGAMLFVGNDNLESGALVQNFAHFINKQLESIGKEIQEISIYFYMPHSSQHWEPYSLEKQEKHRQEAKKIYRNKKKRYQKYASGNYEFLLLLSPDDICEALKEERESNTVLEDILKNSGAHLLESLLNQVSSEQREDFQKIIREKYFLSTRINNDFDKSICSAAKNNYQQVLDLFPKEIIVNAQDDQGNTALHWAIKYNRIELVKYLIEIKSDLKAFDENDLAAIHLAVIYKRPEILKLLLNHPYINVNLRTNDLKNICYTPLHLAVKYSDDSPDIFRLLLENEKTDINKKTRRKNETALQLSIRKEHLRSFKLLCRNKRIYTDINKKDFFNILKLSAKYQYQDIFLYALENVNFSLIDDDFCWKEVLIELFNHADEEFIIFLLEKQVVKPQNLLHLALIKLNNKIIDFILKNGEKYPIDDNLVRQNEILTILQHYQKTVLEVKNHNNELPMFWAIKNNQLKFVEYLMEINEDYFFKSHSEHNLCAFQTLLLATEYKNTEIFKLLLRNILGPNDDLTQALHWAIQKGFLKIIPYLIEIGADINAYDKEGYTPLYLAAERNRFDIMEQLLSHPELNLREAVTAQKIEWEIFLVHYANEPVYQRIQKILEEPNKNLSLGL